MPARCPPPIARPASTATEPAQNRFPLSLAPAAVLMPSGVPASLSAGLPARTSFGLHGARVEPLGEDGRVAQIPAAAQWISRSSNAAMGFVLSAIHEGTRKRFPAIGNGISAMKGLITNARCSRSARTGRARAAAHPSAGYSRCRPVDRAKAKRTNTVTENNKRSSQHRHARKNSHIWAIPPSTRRQGPPRSISWVARQHSDRNTCDAQCAGSRRPAYDRSGLPFRYRRSRLFQALCVSWWLTRRHTPTGRARVAACSPESRQMQQTARMLLHLAATLATGIVNGVPATLRGHQFAAIGANRTITQLASAAAAESGTEQRSHYRKQSNTRCLLKQARARISIGRSEPEQES